MMPYTKIDQNFFRANRSSTHVPGLKWAFQDPRALLFTSMWLWLFHVKTLIETAEPSKILGYLAEYLTYEPWHVIPTMWYFDKCRLRRACAASSKA